MALPYVISVTDLNNGQLVVTCKRLKVPAKKTIGFMWHGDVPFEVRFDPTDCPFQSADCVLEANGTSAAGFKTRVVNVKANALLNHPYEYTVASNGVEADPIIIIRTIQYYEAIADEIPLSALFDMESS
jgi:hypothetical protein